MSETVSDIVSMSMGSDAQGVKTAIGDVLQQKIMVALENKKKDIASSFLSPKSNAKETVTTDTSKTPPETESKDVEDGSS